MKTLLTSPWRWISGGFILYLLSIDMISSVTRTYFPTKVSINNSSVCSISKGIVEVDGEIISIEPTTASQSRALFNTADCSTYITGPTRLLSSLQTGDYVKAKGEITSFGIHITSAPIINPSSSVHNIKSQLEGEETSTSEVDYVESRIHPVEIKKYEVKGEKKYYYESTKGSLNLRRDLKNQISEFTRYKIIFTKGSNEVISIEKL